MCRFLYVYYTLLCEKALHDEASALKNAKAEGEAIGIAKGRAEAISKMKVLGFTEDRIRSNYTHFSQGFSDVNFRFSRSSDLIALRSAFADKFSRGSSLPPFLLRQ